MSRKLNNFIGIASLDLFDPYGATRELERCIKGSWLTAFTDAHLPELNFKAVRVLPWLWNTPPNDKHYYPIYVKCIELDIPFCCQVGHTGPLMPSEPGRPIPYIDEIALKFPKLKIVGGHIGYPWTEEMISLAWKHENVVGFTVNTFNLKYIDTSAYDPKYYPPQLVQYLKTRGKHKVMFGTNFPQLSLRQCTEHLKYLQLPEEVEANFLWKNAYKVRIFSHPFTFFSGIQNRGYLQTLRLYCYFYRVSNIFLINIFPFISNSGNLFGTTSSVVKISFLKHSPPIEISNLSRIETINDLISIRANFCPIQERVPTPKGSHS